MVKFTYENGWIYGEDIYKSSAIADCAAYFDTDYNTRKVGDTLFVKFDLKYLPQILKMVEERQLKYVKGGAIVEWKKLNNIALPGTPLDVLMNILNKWDSTKVGLEVTDEYIDVSLPFGTHTIKLDNGKVVCMSTWIELFDGDERIADSATIYVTESGDLDIKVD